MGFASRMFAFCSLMLSLQWREVQMAMAPHLATKHQNIKDIPIALHPSVVGKINDFYTRKINDIDDHGIEKFFGASRVSAKPAMRGHFKTGHSSPEL
jgi:hypothetical protein